MGNRSVLLICIAIVIIIGCERTTSQIGKTMRPAPEIQAGFLTVIDIGGHAYYNPIFSGWIEGEFQENNKEVSDYFYIGGLFDIPFNDENGNRYFEKGDVIEIEIIERVHKDGKKISIVRMLSNKMRPEVVYFTDEVLYIWPPPPVIYGPSPPEPPSVPLN